MGRLTVREKTALKHCLTHVEAEATKDGRAHVRVFTETEVHRSARGGVRADGLVVVQGPDGERCIVIEAKSSRTKRDLRVRRAEPFVPLALLLGATAVTVALVLAGPAPELAIALGSIGVLAVAAGAAGKGMAIQGRAREPRVFEQLQQYPGHERWFAAPRDTFRHDDELERHLAECKARNVGFFTTSRGVPTEHHRPVRAPSRTSLATRYKLEKKVPIREHRPKLAAFSKRACR